MAPFNVLITGCNRGIGLELTKHFIKLNPTNLFVTCRNPSKADDLNNLAKANPNVHVLTLEVTDHSSFAGIADFIASKVGDDGLNLVINNAGILNEKFGAPPTVELMRENYEVNCIAPMFFTRALVPLIKKAAAARSDLPIGIRRAAIVMMSSKVASLDDNTGGGVYAYRCSKVAQNMVMKNMSLEYKDSQILVMAMHPGWVKTDIGGSNASTTTEECVTSMIKTMEGLTKNENGKFFDYKNEEIKW